MTKILDVVKPGVLVGEDVQKLFAVAKENGYAFPAVNCVGTDSINSVLEAAAKARSAVIVQFSNGGAAFIAGKGLKIDRPQGNSILGAISGALHVHNVAKEYGVPVVLHTDHCAKKLIPWVDGLLDAGEEYFKQHGKPLFSSHMLDLSEEHLKDNIDICCQYLERMAKMGIIPITNTHFIPLNGSDYHRFFGERVNYLFALRSFIDAGLRPCIGCDAPTAEVSAIKGLDGAVNRIDRASGEVIGPNQRITMREAIRCYTINAAYASFEDDIKGSIEVGKLADFTIFDNLTTAQAVP